VTTPGLIEDERGEEFGLDPAAVEALADQARRYVDDEELPSLQFAVARHGRLALALAFGNVETRAGVQAANSDTLYAGFSVTKTVVASAAWLLAQDGRLDVKRPVAEIVPEFATNGKEVVTVEQLLTHTAGFPNAPFDPNEWNDIEKRLARFAAWRLDWEPGSRFAYHAMSSMWVVAEIIERSAGKDFREFIRSRIAAPLGLSNLHVGVPAELDDRVANVRFVGTPGATDDPASREIESIAAGTSEEARLELYNGRSFRSVGVPGGGGIMTASDLAIYYQALLGDRRQGDDPIWTPTTLDWARTVRTGDMIDPMTGKKANRALGIIVAGDRDRIFRGFAKGNSPDTFGHPGMGGQVAWADPATGVSFAALTDGHDRDPWKAGLRCMTLSEKAAACIER
jgi:CubicO group peptidase (beta-lactamase class C family)